MSRKITQPVNQVRLTNVAVVRMNRNGERFEVACYKNKIMNYRQGLETDLSEVLQTPRIFTNVSRGKFAPTSSLKRNFQTTDQDIISRIILDSQQSDAQISDMERLHQIENVTKEICAMICDKCVDPKSNRPYGMNQVRDAMREVGFRVRIGGEKSKSSSGGGGGGGVSVKQQFLECVKVLKVRGVLDIERAKMELRIVLLDTQDNDDNNEGSVMQEVKTELEEVGVKEFVTSDDDNDDKNEVKFLIDPSLYRQVENISKNRNGARLEIIRQCVTEEGEINLGSDIQRRKKEQRRLDDGGGGGRNDDDDDDKEEELKTSMEQMCPITSTTKDEEEQEQEEEVSQRMNSRKAQKKAQKKKSKKAKRREKEEAMERLARKEKEEARQSERAKKQALSPVNDDVDVVDDAVVKSQTDNNNNNNNNLKKSCNTCGGAFESNAAYRSHFRSDWHRFNVKLKMKGMDVVGEEEFRLCDSDAFFEDAL